MLFDLPGSLVGDVVTLPEVLIANGYFDRTPPVKVIPMGNDEDSEDPAVVLKPNRVSQDVSDAQSAADQGEKQDR